MITTVSDKEIAQAAEIERLRQEVTAWSVTVENLEAERDALKADAARWVYWRDYHGFSGYFDEGATASPESADIDAACDAARKRVQP